MKIDLCQIFGVEEGEEFRIKLEDYIMDYVYKIKNNLLYYMSSECNNCEFYTMTFDLNNLSDITDIIKLPKKKQFTDDELAIMRSLPVNYKWIARDRSGEIFIYIRKPEKEDDIWDNCGVLKELELFEHLFQSIQWEDEEPLYIPDYVERM